MNDCLLEQKKGEVAAMDKTIAQEIVSFLSATLGIRPDDADFVKAKEGVMKEEPDYSWFFYVLGANTPSTGALAMTVETMKLRVENHIKLRGMMLKP